MVLSGTIERTGGSVDEFEAIGKQPANGNQPGSGRYQFSVERGTKACASRQASHSRPANVDLRAVVVQKISRKLSVTRQSDLSLSRHSIVPRRT